MADATGESKPSRDLITFLGWTRPLVKEITLVGGAWVKRAAPEAAHFDVSEAKVANLSDVERRLRQAAEVGAVMIHGRLTDGTSPHGVRRRKVHFEDMPHRWIVVDLDALPPGPADPAEAATIARSMLPPEFHGATCIWQATAGHALTPGKVRLRLIFWGARPVSLPEVDAWLSACDAKPDRSVWRTVQPIFLGTRVVGGPDPVPQRWGRLAGAPSVAVPSDLAVIAKATVERLTALPENVAADAQHMVEDVVALLRSRTADRIGRDGRHMTIFHAANDALDRGLTEPVTLAMLTAWTAGDDEAEAELADALKDAGVSTAADLARSVRLSGEALADTWSSGEPLEADAVERMTGDALQSRTAPIGNLYREPMAFGALPTVEDALAAVEEAWALGLDLDAPAETLRVAMANDDAPEARTDALMREVERLKVGSADAMERLATIVREHGRPEAPVIDSGDAPKLARGIVIPHARPLVDLADVPATRWLAYPTHARGVVGAMVGPGGVAKSRLAIAEAVGFACGRPEVAGFAAETMLERCSAWVHVQEDAESEIDQRVAALRRHWRIPAAALDGSEGYQLYTTSGLDHAMSLAWRDPATKAPIVNPQLGQMVDFIRTNAIGLVVLDPVVELHKLGENDPADMRVVWGAGRRIAHETGAHVVFVAHSRKPEGATNDGHAGDINTLRGSGAASGVIRCGRTVFSMSERDARALRVNPLHRGRYLRLDDAKNNLAPMRSDPLWFERVTIRRDDDRRNDVGIVVRADLSRGDLSECDRLAEQVAETIRDKFAAGKPHALADIIAAVPGLAQAFGEDRAHWTELFRVRVLGGRQATRKQTLSGLMTYTSTRGRGGGSFVQFDPDRDVSGAFEAVEE